MKATAQLHEELINGETKFKRIYFHFDDNPAHYHSFTPEELRAIIQAAQPILDKLK